MNIAIGIVIGLIVGAGVVYWWSQQQLDQQIRESENKQQQLQASLESDHEKRLQDTITSLRTDYDRASEQKIAAAKQEQETAWQNRIESLETEYQQRQQAKEQEYEQRIAALQSQHQQALQQLQQSHEAQVQRIEQEYAAKLKTQATLITLPQKAVEIKESSDRDLSFADTVESWGNTGSIAYIPQLAAHLQSPSDRVREEVAIALGKIAKDRSPRFEIIQIIEYLGRLCRDTNADVRKAAIASLGKIKAESVIPLLQQGLRDSNSDVVQAASDAIARYKSYPQTPKIKTLPRNARPLESP